MLLNAQKHEVDLLKKHGSINEDEHTEIRDELNIRINNLDYIDLTWESYDDLSTIHLVCPSFPSLQGDLKKRVNENKKSVKFAKGETIFSKGQEAKGIYIIVKGLVDELFDSGWSHTHSRGGEIGYHSILCAENASHDSYVARSTLTAQTAGEYFFLDTNTIKELCDSNKDYNRRIYQISL